ncbi:MAG: hemolysin family protein [Methylotenera sp.]|uniref:hemolysin family protein n=1 Tax=Methylotenera sp. TaxID=2051956 RepID=UPI00248A487B|nr:hemolysin family protein [Methylotenera sp.]MDI1309211.1 hemolysin family protein [Methylotenera sp.]
MSANFLLIFIAFLLVLLNGFFVAAEFSLVKLRSTRVRTIATTLGWRGRMLAKVHSNLDTYLSACQLGITLSSLGLGWIGEPAFAALIEPLLAQIGVTSLKLIHSIAFIFAFFTISYLHIVLGELVPKSLAIRMSERVGIWTAPALYGFYWLMFPAIWLLNQSSNVVIRALKLKNKVGHDSHYSTEELKLILRSSHASEEFSDDEWKVLAQAIDFRELEVSDLMHPFSEAVALYEEDTFDENMDRILQHRYSRYPLVNDNGVVTGIVHIKDIFVAMRKNVDFTEIKSLARPIEQVPPSTHAMTLFRKLQKGAPHFTVVGYSNAAPIGYITLDNLLSALVGDIRDEFRQSQSEWAKLNDGSLLGKGTLPLNTLERTLGIDIESEDADTIAGLILWALGDLPKEGQRVSFTSFDVVVKKMIGPRILLVRVYPKIQVVDNTSAH